MQPEPFLAPLCCIQLEMTADSFCMQDRFTTPFWITFLVNCNHSKVSITAERDILYRTSPYYSQKIFIAVEENCKSSTSEKCQHNVSPPVLHLYWAFSILLYWASYTFWLVINLNCSLSGHQPSGSMSLSPARCNRNWFISWSGCTADEKHLPNWLCPSGLDDPL